ncbi:MAG: phytase [Cyanobacteria bacterium P01_A01_bin.45]
MTANNTQSQVRFATFNVALNRNSAGELIDDLATGDDTQAQGIAEIIQRTDADILLLNEFDYDANGDAINNFKSNYLEVSQNGVDPIEYPYVYFAPVNTGVASGFDLNNDGTVGTQEGTFELANDAFGFGTFPGQYGMVLLSKYPIETEEVRTFQNFLWKDMPNGFLSDDPSVDNPSTEVNENLNGYYSPEEIDALRLSSKSHWDIPINVNGETIHVLASHPTPPVFDGEEDRNGKRNHDEIRFWSDYVIPKDGDYIYDDNGSSGGLNPGEKFVIMGDQNADPNDGDSTDNAILQLLDNPQINTSVTPESQGGVEAAQIQGGINATHTGNPAFDTGDFNDENPGNLRVDYVLPSEDLNITDAQVFWSETDRGFDDLVVFGDSYSDTGNVFNLSGQLFPPSPPYFEGRLSNGPLWVDILAEELSLEDDDIQNFAFLGARSDREVFIPPNLGLDPNIGSQFPGLLDQIDQFSATTGGNGADPDDLYFVWLNGNDFQNIDLNNLGEVQTAVTSFFDNISTAVTSLANLGAEKIVVPNVIDLGLLPQAIDAGISQQGTIGAVAVNQLLSNALFSLEQSLGVDIIKIDTFALTQEIATSPGDFGFSNITDPLLEEVNPTNPEEFLFYDTLHFTTEGHEIIALEFIDALDIEPSTEDIEASSDHRLVYVDVEVTGEDPPAVVTPKAETPQVVDIKDVDNAIPGDADDPAIWVNPNNPSDSLVIGTLKDGGLATFNLSGELQQRILPDESSNPFEETLGEFGSVSYNNVDIIYDFQAAGFTPSGTFTTDLAVVSDRENDSLAFFSINSETGELSEFATSTYNPSESIFSNNSGDNPTIFGVDDGEQTAYGLTTYTSPESGKSYVFVTQGDGNKVAQIELIPQVGPADEPFIDGKVVRILELPVPTGNPEDSQAEGLVVDKELGILYVAMESEVGILKFGAEPDSGNDFSIIQSKFNNIVTFGDSLADVGNAFTATNQTIPPSPPYFEGRLSNGLLGVELFAQQLGLSASTPAFTNGNNFALGGSEFGSGNDDFGGEPRTGELINLYLSQNTPSPDDIFYIFGGANNFFPNLNSDVTPQEIIANIPDPESVVNLLTDHITTLASAGAKTFVVPNLVPLGNTPFAQFTGTSEELNAASIAYNDLLDIELDELENQLESTVDADIDIIEIDVEKRFNEIKADPGAFGLTNVTDPAFNQQTEEIVPNPSEFFWWDSLHPSAAAYELVSELTIEEFTQQIDLLEDDSESPLIPDIEGLTIYYGADGEGYLIASSQGDSSYAVFSREGDNEYLGSFTIGENGDIDQVNETDGLDIINVPLGDEYPNGLLVVQDGADDPQVFVEDDGELENVSSNFKFVDLGELVKALPDINLDTSSYNPRSADSDNPPINNQELPKLELINNTLKFSPGNGTVNLKAQLTGFDSNSVDEIGLFIVEDEAGTITDSQGNTLTPADGDAYIIAALEQSQILFSNLPNQPNGFSNSGTRNLPNFSSGEQLVFYKIEQGSADGVINGQIPTNQVNLGLDTVEINDLGNEEFNIAFSDGESSITLTVTTSSENLPIGVSSQSGNAELIDLSDITGQVTANFTVYREAVFNNSVYFYRLDNTDGLTGGVAPDEQDYLQAALDNIVQDALTGEIVEFSSENQGVTTGSATIEAGTILGTMIVANGNYEQLVDADINNDPEVYFSFLGANSDKVDHISSLSDNTLGFEDLANGGDNDLNDVILKVDFSL